MSTMSFFGFVGSAGALNSMPVRVGVVGLKRISAARAWGRTKNKSAWKEVNRLPTIDFKFSPNDKVKTAIGDIGMVTSCSITSGAVKQYWVLMNNGRGAWFDEDQLTLPE